MNKSKGVILFTVLVLAMACAKEGPSGRTAGPSEIGSESSEIDMAEIQSSVGIQFKVLKSETIGYVPTHKFLWICLPQPCPAAKVENLATAIIKDIIKRKPRTYHSFTIHFFNEPEIKKNLHQSRPFAKATYLPDGEWTKVGRAPIDGYQSYRLKCDLKLSP